jgi:hypothetical protein
MEQNNQNLSNQPPIRPQAQSSGSIIPPVPTMYEQTARNAPPQQQPIPAEHKFSLGKLLKFILPFTILIILGIIAFIVVDKFNAPVKVREKASIMQPIFYDLNAVNKKIAEQLKSEISPDADTFQREEQKGKDYLVTAANDINKLTVNMNSISMGEFDSYKKNLRKYLESSGDLMTMQEESIKILSEYQSPIRKYQQLEINISGASTYLFSDPQQYVNILNEAIASEEDIINQLKDMKFSEDWSSQHNWFIKTMTNEKDYLMSMKNAVDQKDSGKIAVAEKEYTQKGQDLAKEGLRLDDEFNAKVDKLSDELNSLSEMIKEDYGQLRTKYSF